MRLGRPDLRGQLTSRTLKERACDRINCQARLSKIFFSSAFDQDQNPFIIKRGIFHGKVPSCPLFACNLRSICSHPRLRPSSCEDSGIRGYVYPLKAIGSLQHYANKMHLFSSPMFSLLFIPVATVPSPILPDSLHLFTLTLDTRPSFALGAETSTS